MHTNPCKNCQNPLPEEDNFCRACGAKVIRNRLTVKALLRDLSTQVLGWDNKYFVTIRHLILKPQVIFKEYLSGTRKKYVNPITFLTVGAAIAVLFFNQFSDEYISMAMSIGGQQTESVTDAIDAYAQQENSAYDKNKVPDFAAKMRDPEQVQRTILKYFNLFTFLLMPIYGLLAFWTFGKPYNYAEHLVIGSYAQGLLFLIGSITFLLSIFVNPNLYFFSFILTLIYYSYAYARLYEYGVGKAFVKLLKFLMLSTLTFLVFSIFAGIVGALIGFLIGYKS